MRRALRVAARVVAVAAVVFAVVAVRVVVASHDELDEGRRLREAGDVDAAIVHYRRAARWYAPGNPYGAEALDALARIGVAAERAGDTDRALAAWRAVRGAILSTRSFYVPHRERLQVADGRIAALMASLEPPPVDAGKSREQIRREHLALLEEVPRPHVGWTVLLLLGFGVWVGATFAFARRGFDADDRLVRAQALRWGLTAAAGFGLFVLGMAFA